MDVAQLSRPYQIALGVVVVLGLVWVMALRGHTSNPSEPAPATHPAQTAPVSAAAKAKAAAAPTPIYRGAAPGVEGLTRAIAKAHEAVATSQQNARQLQSKSADASGESHASASAAVKVAAAKGVSGATATQKSIVADTLARKHAARVHNRTGSYAKTRGRRNAVQGAVEGELTHGKTVMLVFWSPSSAVDQEVKAQAGALAASSKGTLALHVALAHQVGTFGAITEVVHVYETPTILIVNRHGLVSTLTGLTDAFGLAQAVREARSAGR
jgi:hypothetical protein